MILLPKDGVEKAHDVIFKKIDATAIYNAAKRTNGSAGPSGMDSDGRQRLLCSKVYGTAGTDLCESVALLTRKLCTEYVDPDPLSAFISCRLVPLDKNPGVRPIGIGEVLRRVMGKAITTLLKPDILKATAPLQASAGLQGGVEGAIHALRNMFDDTDNEGILLVDADNAFNRLNRKVALHNTSVICPEFSVYLVNTYRKPARLYIPNSNGAFILSQEGTTQGDNCASAFYSCSLIPLMLELPTVPPDLTDPDLAKHVWFADDSGAARKLAALKIWWDALQRLGPSYGYYPKPSKSWLVVKEEHYEKAKEMFKDVQITTKGQRYLGSFIGTNEGKEEFILEKCKEWTEEIEGLASIALHEPQLAYCAFTLGSSRRWSFLMRTTPNISQLLGPIEEKIRHTLIPNITGRMLQSDDERALFALPARLGGLAFTNPVEVADTVLKCNQSC